MRKNQTISVVKERIEATTTGLTVVVRLNLVEYQKDIKVDKSVSDDIILMRILG